MSHDDSSPASRSVLSVVVPVFNEQESLVQLIDELKDGIGRSVASFEIILVDDGSTDDSWRLIAELSQVASTVASSENRVLVSGIRLRRNFGKAAALTAGIKIATGELILMLDADLQDDPAEFPELLKQINAGYDVVNGWKERRLDARRCRGA